MIAARPRPLPASFATWLSLSSEAEILALLRLVVEAAERRGYVPRVEYVKPAASLLLLVDGPGRSPLGPFSFSFAGARLAASPMKED